MCTEHSIESTPCQNSDMELCALCGYPISKWFYVTLSGGQKVCEPCIFQKMQERREKIGA